jgi:hypothetical protein
VAFGKARSDSKETWQLAQELTGHGKTQSQGIGDIQGCKNNMEKASAFNQFYIDIAPKLAKAVPKTEKNFMDFMPTIDREEIQPLEFKPVFFDDVEKILTDMLGKVSFSHDAISNKKL